MVLSFRKIREYPPWPFRLVFNFTPWAPRPVWGPLFSSFSFQSSFHPRLTESPSFSYQRDPGFSHWCRSLRRPVFDSGRAGETIHQRRWIWDFVAWRNCLWVPLWIWFDKMSVLYMERLFWLCPHNSLFQIWPRFWVDCIDFGWTIIFFNWYTSFPHKEG